MLKRLSTAVAQRLPRFLKKEYRDGYLETHVRSGIALQIRALREKAAMSQEGFAKAIGKKQSVISRLEDTGYGRVNVQTLLDIACARNVALLVRFVDYPQFLRVTADMSPQALGPDNIYESQAKAEATEKNALLSRLFPVIPKGPEQGMSQGEVSAYSDIFERQGRRETPPIWDVGNLYQSTVQRVH